MRAVIVLLVLFASSGVRAQEAAPPPDAPVTRARRAVVLVPGEDVRVDLRSGQHVSGSLVEAGPDVLVLEVGAEQPLTLLPSDVTGLSVKRRRVLQGTLLGSAAGAGGGALFGLLLSSIASSESSDVNVPLFSGAFALLGSFLGAGAGTVLGLSLPRWSSVFEGSADGTFPTLRDEPTGELARWLAHPGPVGELGLQLGYARELGLRDSTGGLGARLHLLARLGDSLAFGPEVAWYPLPSERVVLSNGAAFDASREVFQLGGLVRAGGWLGPVRPSLLVGLGFTSSRTLGFVAYSLGAEVEVRPMRSLPALAIEARFHDNLQNLGNNSDPRFLTLGAGTRLKW